MESPTYPPEYDDAVFAFANPPLYNCSVRATANVLLKHEFVTPRLKSPSRRWQMARANLRGTVLTLGNDLSSMHLSMQAGEVGIAADYRRRSHCLRVRVEGRQLLLALSSMRSCLEWYRRLDEAIAISLPLEFRKEPSFRAGFRKHSYHAAPSLRGEIICSWRDRRNSECGKWLRCNDECIGPPEGLSCHELTISLPNGNDRSVISTAEDASRDLIFDSGKLGIRGTSSNIGALDYSQRCARELLYSSLWTSSWYYRNGQRHDVRDSTYLEIP